MKKGLIAAWVVVFLGIILLVANFGMNESAIEKYHSGKATEKTFFKQVLIQPYIYYYNKGNVYYNEGEYEQAVNSYEKALRKNPSKRKECKVRINLVLSKLAMLSLENLTEEQKTEVIAYLQECIDILTEDGCAAHGTFGGHDEEAQTLKNEIERMIQSLSNATPQSGDESDDTEEPEDDPSEQTQSGKTNSKVQQLEETYREIQNQSVIERNQSIDDSRNAADSDPFDFNGYDGNCW